MKENKVALPVSSVFEKFIYSIGNIGANLCWVFVSAYVTMYYTDSVGLAAATAGTIMLASRLLDGVSDIACSWMFKKAHFKLGKIRPWFIIAAPLMTIGMLLIFHVPALSLSGKTVYAFITYAFTQAIAYTIFCLAQSAIVAVVSYEPKDRANLTAVAFAIINLSSVMINILTPLILTINGGASIQKGWTVVTIIYAIGSGLLVSLMGFFLKEKEPPAGYNDVALNDSDGEKQNWGKIVGYLLKSKYTWILIFVHLFAWMLQGIQGIEVYFYRDVLGDMNLYGLYGNIYIVAVIIGVLFGPVLSRLLKNRNKANMIGLVISMIGILGYLKFASLDTRALFAVCLFMKGFGYGPLLGSAFVYSADMADYISEKYHVVAAETTSMTSSIGIKVGMGVGAGLVGWMLTAAGYNADLATQTAATQSGIHLVFTLVPFVCTLLTFLFLTQWKLNKS